MISIPAGSVEPSSLAFQRCHPHSHAPMGGHSVQYGVLPLHPHSRIIEELNKTLALTMQRFERCGSNLILFCSSPYRHSSFFLTYICIGYGIHPVKINKIHVAILCYFD